MKEKFIPPTKETLAETIKNSKSVAETARKLNINFNTVIRYSNKYNIDRSHFPVNTRYIDISNKRFGKLLVIKHVFSNIKKRLQYWECKCDCGNTKVILKNSLSENGTKSCRLFKN